MVNDILVLLMMAFGLFAIIMFVLFYTYLKRNYNHRHLNEEYDDDDDKNMINEEIITIQDKSKEEFVPKKKK